MWFRRSTAQQDPDGLIFPDLDPPKFAVPVLEAEKELLSALQDRPLSELLDRKAP